MDKEKLIEQANIYKAGDSGVDHDEADFWLWCNYNRREGIEFILKLSEDKLTCMSPEDLWHMTPAYAKECTVVDITEGYCPECPFSDRCVKTHVVEEVNSAIDEEKSTD